MSNRTTVWSKIFVDELIRCGVSTVCIAPGSRSTPLTLAFAENPNVQIYSHLDERSAAFFALGLALADDKPVAVVCTSGTATANFYPAIIEAHQSNIPLLVLTTDRPPELRHSGANQTIDQIKMYGDQVLWSVEVALPEADPPDVAIRNLRTLACRAYATANGLVKGVVHLNFPFRKPLEPTPVESDNTDIHIEENRPLTAFSRGILFPDAAQVDALADVINSHERGLIICGPRCPEGAFPQAVAELSRRSGYPIFADPLSNVRFGEHQKDTVIVGSYETLLHNNTMLPEAPEAVIRFGNMPTSNWLNTYLDRISPAHRFHIKENGLWADDSHRTTHFMQVNETILCEHVAGKLDTRLDSAWLAQIARLENTSWEIVEQEMSGEYFDGVVLADILNALSPHSTLFVGNSLPVRHLDQFARPMSKQIRVFGNRGASGIDGVISSAVGAGADVLVIGDISFYHDMNGLLAVQRCGRKITIVLLNNNGGGIFYRLPIAKFDPPFTDLFVTPHGLNFEHAAKMYGLDFFSAADDFPQTFKASLDSPQSTLIEVKTDAQRDLARRNALISTVKKTIYQGVE